MINFYLIDNTAFSVEKCQGRAGEKGRAGNCQKKVIKLISKKEVF